MTTSDHTTRTLLLSRAAPGTLVVTKGSTSNIDFEAEMLSTGHSTVKAFDVGGDVGRTRDLEPALDYNSEGRLLGWGLRNEVGIAEEPVNYGVYGVENSADELVRAGVDIHKDNPAEELNFLGYLNAKRTAPGGVQSRNQGKNFGYPRCFTAWDPSALPKFGKPVGTQFSLEQNSTQNDTACASNYIAPALSFQAHMAPLDIKFNGDGTTAWVSFHGSWDRDDPVGYKIGAVAFEDGKPSAGSASKTALNDIVWNADNSKCPENCFRPVAMAWDIKGRLFFSSDATGEIYVLSRDFRGDVNQATVPVRARNAVAGGGSEGSGSESSGAAMPSTTTSGSHARPPQPQGTRVSSAWAGIAAGVGAYLMA